MHIPRARVLTGAVATALLGVAHPARTQSVPPATAPPGRDSPIREYRGTYRRSFEQSWFEPCNAPPDDKLWWVTLTDQALLERDSLLAKVRGEPADGLAVRWRATVGPRMPAGMMGRGTRYILVTEILDVKPLPDVGACGTSA